MSVDSERTLQNRVRHWLIDELSYINLGNLESLNNKPVKDDLLRKNLNNGRRILATLVVSKTAFYSPSCSTSK